MNELTPGAQDMDKARTQELLREEELLNLVNPFERLDPEEPPDMAFLILAADVTSSPHPDRITLMAVPQDMYLRDAPDLTFLADLANKAVAGEVVMVNFNTNEAPRSLPATIDVMSALGRSSILKSVPIRILRSATTEILFSTAPEDWSWWSEATLSARTASMEGPGDADLSKELFGED